MIQYRRYNWWPICSIVPIITFMDTSIFINAIPQLIDQLLSDELLIPYFGPPSFIPDFRI